jgi:hypothetical protein
MAINNSGLANCYPGLRGRADGKGRRLSVRPAARGWSCDRRGTLEFGQFFDVP